MTQDNIKKYQKELNQKNLMIVSSVFLFLLIFNIAHLLLSKEKEGIAQLINVSGRQRMLSQRITLHVVQNKDFDLLEKDFNLFKQSHFKLEKNTDEKIKDFYQTDLNYKVEQFYNIIDRKMVTQENLQFIKGDLLKSLNQAVLLFEAKSNQVDFYTRVLNFSFFGIMTIFLAYLFFLVLRPLMNKIIRSLGEYDSEKHKAQSALEAKSLFFANMSHEIRTPLNGIIGLTDIVMDQEHDLETTKNLENIKKASQTLGHIINDILDLSKLEAGRISLERSDFSPNALINEIVSILNPKAKSKEIQLISEIDNNIPQVVYADLQKTKQIITNITNNAIKFTKEGTVKINTQYRNGNLYINIKDTGIGIKEKDLNNLFMNYSQIENTYVKTQEGTGLGLAISKRFAQLMDGDITVTSVYGSGSSFTLMVPSPVSNVVNLKSKERTFEVAFQINNKILVAEDNLINQKVIGKFLEKFNLQVDFADNGKKVVELYKNNQYEFVFMDISMPIMNGFDAAKLIIDYDPNAIIFALSANVFTEDQQKAKDCGMKEFLTKPLNRNELIETLNNYFPRSTVESKFK